MDDLQRIASGDAVPWQETLTHPVHGEMVARISDMPKNSDWLRHANRQDQLIREFGGDPDAISNRTATLAAAIAGFQVLFDPIVIDERTVEDRESGHERTERVFYDPLKDEEMTIAMTPWIMFMAWRNQLLERTSELGKSSGETAGSESDGSSLAGTDSPSMIPA